jgi:hypothetical protein
VVGEAIELGAVCAQGGEQLLLVGVQVADAVQQPAGDLVDLRRRRAGVCRCSVGAQRLQVAVDGAEAASATELGDPGMQHGGARQRSFQRRLMCGS